MRFEWTAKAKTELAEMLTAGKTAAECGKHFGVSRSAITGLVCRDATLKEVGFARRGKSRNGGRTKRFTAEEREERRRLYNRAYKANKRAGAIIIPFPTSTRTLPVGSPQVKGFQLRVVSTNVPMLVEDWLARNGGPRRFEYNDRADFLSVQSYLTLHGVSVRETKNSWNNSKSLYHVTNGPGRPRTVSWPGVIAIVDQFRVAEGKQPFGAHSAGQIMHAGVG